MYLDKLLKKGKVQPDFKYCLTKCFVLDGFCQGSILFSKNNAFLVNLTKLYFFKNATKFLIVKKNIMKFALEIFVN